MSKSDLRDPLNPLFFSLETNYVYLQKHYLCQLTTMPYLRCLNWVFVDLKKNAQKYFFKPLFGALPKIFDWIRKYVQIHHGFYFSKMVLKRVIALTNQPFWWSKWPKNARNSWWNLFGPPKPLFCIKDKKVYIHNVGHIWAYIHANSQDFWKSFNGSDKTKHVKNLFFNPFGGTSKKRRLDLKVWADPSWLLVLKNGLKKHSSLINVWSSSKNVT